MQNHGTRLPSAGEFQNHGLQPAHRHTYPGQEFGGLRRGGRHLERGDRRAGRGQHLIQEQETAPLPHYGNGEHR